MNPETGEEFFHTFTYNADGLRIQRTCYENGRVYNYVYDGSLLTQMSVDGNVLRFTYDANGTPLTVIYEDITYYYVVNLQGDIVAILDSTGTKIVSYTYDAWGNILTTTGSMAQTLGSLNPLRYRGYVYDTETGLYYLQSRYYNPQWGRFITADCFVYTGQGVLGNNMFVYCGNNPIIRSDSAGQLWEIAIHKILIAGLAGIAAVVVKNQVVAKYNYAENSKIDADPETTTKNKIINDQYGTTGDQFVYGAYKASWNACETIAVHNAKVLMGKESTLSETM